MSQPLILAAQLDPDTFGVLDPLRQQHFPPERNFLSAHITLFHALPGDENTRTSIQHTLQQVCAAQPVLALAFPKPRFLGRGVALQVMSDDLLRVRAELAQVWREWLTPQDRQPYQPHVTVQNKVPPEQARRLYEQLATAWTPLTGWGTGLVLWRYKGGPWELVEAVQFAK